MANRYQLARKVILPYEGYSPVPYKDVGNTWAIGFGLNLGPKNAIPKRMSLQAAVKAVDQRLMEKERLLIKSLGQVFYDRLKPQTQAALLSVAYNLGDTKGVPQFAVSVRNALNQKSGPADEQRVAQTILRYSSKLEGIKARRADEARLALATDAQLDDFRPRNTNGSIRSPQLIRLDKDQNPVAYVSAFRSADLWNGADFTPKAYQLYSGGFAVAGKELSAPTLAPTRTAARSLNPAADAVFD